MQCTLKPRKINAFMAVFDYKCTDCLLTGCAIDKFGKIMELIRHLTTNNYKLNADSFEDKPFFSSSIPRFCFDVCIKLSRIKSLK